MGQAEGGDKRAATRAATREVTRAATREVTREVTRTVTRIVTRRVTCLQLTERARARVQAVLQQPEAVWDEGTCAGAALSSLFIAGSCFDPASHAHDGAPCVIGSDTNQRARVPICLLSPLFGQLMVPPRYNVQL